MKDYTLVVHSRYRCSLSPWNAGIEKLLTAERRSFAKTPLGRVESCLEKRQFFRDNASGSKTFSSGFAKQVVDWIKSQGGEVDIYLPHEYFLGWPEFDTRNHIRDSRDEQAFSQLSSRIQNFISFAHRKWMMRLIEPSDKRVVQLIAGYAAAYSHARIAIGVSTDFEKGGLITKKLSHK